MLNAIVCGAQCMAYQMRGSILIHWLACESGSVEEEGKQEAISIGLHWRKGFKCELTCAPPAAQRFAVALYRRAADALAPVSFSS